MYQRMLWSNRNEGSKNEEMRKQELEDQMGTISTFKSILEEAEDESWYMDSGAGELSGDRSSTHLLLQQKHQMDSSASSSGSVLMNPFHHQVIIGSSLPPKSLILGNPSKPLLIEGTNMIGSSSSCFDYMGCDNPAGFLDGSGIFEFNDFGMPNPNSSFTAQESTGGFGELGFDEGSLKGNNPLPFAQIGSLQPNPLQKRAVFRRNLGSDTNPNQIITLGGDDDDRNMVIGEIYKTRTSDEDETSNDVSNLNCGSDDQVPNRNRESSAVRGGKNKKGLPAKNLMAERRRRKKLNDRLFMLRSVVPKISKMDRASILGDAVEYLKELLQRINDLQNELETANFTVPPMSLPTPPPRVKEEHALSPTGQPQPARVEVSSREGGGINVHMYCGFRQGILLSMMRAMDSLGLDIQQAVISCFNGFALDVFRAEQWQGRQELQPDQIKAVLLDSAGLHGVI